MIRSVKVSQSDVKAFMKASVSARDYSEKFEGGIQSIEQLSQYALNQETSIRESISSMIMARNTLAIKIRSTEETVMRIQTQMNELESRLEQLENEKETISESLSIEDESGNEKAIPNPAYVTIQSQIMTLQSEMGRLHAEMQTQQQRLNRANAIDNRLLHHIEQSNGVVYSLGEKQSSCKQLASDLREISEKNRKKSAEVVEKTGKISDLITAYLKIRMNYDDPRYQSGGTSMRPEININISVNKTVISSNTTNHEDALKQTSPNEKIVEVSPLARAKTDRPIVEYGGKLFGGKYNTYEERLGGTNAENNPLLGSYEGERGESKFIPTGRTAEGVRVIKILERYGLTGINYYNAEPDFEPCSEAVVIIKNMTANRVGNFAQADVECATLWNLSNRQGRSDWVAEDVYDYRKENKLSWHEKCDTKTMVLMPTEINDFFKHYGGVSECRKRDGLGTDGGGFDE